MFLVKLEIQEIIKVVIVVERVKGRRFQVDNPPSGLIYTIRKLNEMNNY